MVKSIKIVIGGKEYTLRGDDENIIQQAAQEVNRQLEELQSRHLDESPSTLAMLAALNIAEMYYKILHQSESDNKYVTEQMNSMSKLLSNEVLKLKSVAVEYTN
jgi:cell division protein ZapA (FtsZ GTPase activity inhibitor)